jgi:hypothetical protein
MSDREFPVPKHVAENLARRHAAQAPRRCVYGCRAEAHLYPCGSRCDEHSPWALEGRPDPRTQVDPRYTLDGLRAAAGIRTDLGFTGSSTVLDQRNRAAGRTVSPERRRAAHDGADTLSLTDRFKRIGVGALFERLRYSERTETNGERYQLDNSFRSSYVRLLVARHPEWADLFELRQLRSA